MFERIHQMRLDHAAGCTEPVINEPKIYFDWAMSKRMERETVEAPAETFRMFKMDKVSRTKSLIGDSGFNR